MNIIDISKTISEDMVVYGNEDAKRIKRNIVMDYAFGSYHESRIDMDMHCGTHIDAPLHMVENGNTIDSVDLSRFIGDCKVYDLTHVTDYIVKRDIENLDIQKDDIILFKTKNSYVTGYDAKFIYLEEDAAHYLAAIQIKCIGIDAMGIERDKPKHEIHKIILEQNIGIIENLQLKEVEAGKYFLSCLPLKIQGCEASPARAILSF